MLPVNVGKVAFQAVCYLVSHACCRTLFLQANGPDAECLVFVQTATNQRLNHISGLYR